MLVKVAVAAVLAVSLVACDGGGSGSSGGGNNQASSPGGGASSPIVPTDAQILTDIATSQGTTTNTPIWDTSQAYGSVGNPFKGSVDGQHSYRWNIERDGLIPILDTSNRPELTTALNNLEAAAGKTLFNRLPSTTNPAQLERGRSVWNSSSLRPWMMMLAGSECMVDFLGNSIHSVKSVRS